MSVIEDQARVRPLLRPGERLLWTGRPGQGLDFRDIDWRDISIAAAIAAFTVYIGRSDESWASLSFDDAKELVVVLAFACIAIGYCLLQPWRRRRILYAVTTQRALILGRGGRDRLQWWELAWLPMLALEKQDARGTILFEEPAEPGGCLRVPFRRHSAIDADSAFVTIERPQIVYDLIARESRNRREELERDHSDPLFTRPPPHGPAPSAASAASRG